MLLVAERYRIAVVLACWMVSACVTIESSTTYSHTLLTRRTSVTTNPNSTSYTAATQIEGHDLLVALRSEESCRTSVVPIYRKEAHITRRPTADPVGRALAPTTTLIAGLVLGGAGIYSYLDADRLAMMSGQSSQRTPGDYRNAGLASATIGAGLLVISLVDSIRLRNTTEFVGDVDGEADLRNDPCHARIFKNTRVAATAARLAWQVQSTSDGNGEVRLDLHDLPEEAFASAELQLALHLDNAVIPLEVTAEAARQLLAALVADGTSQVSRDRDARAAALCAEHIAAASAVAIDADTPANEVEQAEARWSLARSKCGDRWQPTHEQEFMAFRAQLAATVAQRARNQCAAAGEAAAQLLNQSGESGERTDLEAIRDLLAERCGGATNASNVLAGFTARANQLRRARAQAEKAEAAAKRREVREPPLQAPQRSCCKVCTRGCPCGNTCISCSKTCHVGPGCAC
jgi:hypothetical protein